MGGRTVGEESNYFPVLHINDVMAVFTSECLSQIVSSISCLGINSIRSYHYSFKLQNTGIRNLVYFGCCDRQHSGK